MTRILVAEDSPTQAFQIQTKLVDEGYEVRVTCDGKEALEQIPLFWPHLLVTDMEMPVMDGLDLVEVSTEQYPSIPVILITAKGSDETAVEALQRGAAAYLPKSLLDEKLFQTIDEVLDVMESADTYSELLGAMEYNEFRFSLENKVELIRPLVDLVQQMVAGVGLCDEKESVRVGVAIDHAVRNAMLHGNLELTKEQLESEDEFSVQGEPTMLQERASMDEYSSRRVHVTIIITPEEATYVIRDEGSGFDLSILATDDHKDILDPSRGRGYVLIKSLMDEVQYNDVGNQVTLVKRKFAHAETVTA
ncbi:MAG: response regulator [Pirellulaceae bacterium]